MAKAKTATKRAAKAAAAVKVRPAPTAKAKPVARPTVAMHQFGSDWSGVSDVTNTRVSRTALPLDRFGTMTTAAMTERDQKALVALKSQFGNAQFERGNIDAGVLRRLGERGFIAHIRGADNAADAVFKLTNRKAA